VVAVTTFVATTCAIVVTPQAACGRGLSHGRRRAGPPQSRSTRCEDPQPSQIEGVMEISYLFAQQSGGTLGQFVPILLIGALFYFLLIRPQQKRARAQRALHGSIEIGDMIVTIGGFHGTVKSIDEGTVRLELNPSTVVTLSKQAIARRVVPSNADAEE
jgi:preprotein translocase subunit YajC